MPKSLRIIFRVEIATLLAPDGNLDISKMERVAMLCTNLMNGGNKVILVSSGAIVLGTRRLKLESIPVPLTGKQAAAAVGQAELITQYQKCFDGFNQTVAQVLLTQDVMEHPVWSKNSENTFQRLLGMNIIPIVNENDSVSTDDIELGDNYPLALQVAKIVHAHMIILRHQMEGFYLVYTHQGENYPVDEEELFSLVEKYRVQNTFLEPVRLKFPARVSEEFIF